MTGTYYFILLLLPILALMPMVVKKNTKRSRGSAQISWAIIGILFVLAITLSLSGLAHEITRSSVTHCPPELVHQNITFGDSCSPPITNPVLKIIVDTFGGPFDTLYVLLIGIPALISLTAIGLIKEAIDARKRRERIVGALWSTPFLVFIAGIILVMAASCGYFKQSSTQTTVENSQRTTTEVTFVDSQHGFSVVYPDYLKTKATDIYDFLLEAEVPGTAQLRGSVMVRATQEPECLVVPEGYKLDSDISDVATTTINGIPFFSFTFYQEQADTGHKVHTYRALRENTCYIINSALSGKKEDVLNSSETTTAQVSKTLDAVARSFRFTSL